MPLLLAALLPGKRSGYPCRAPARHLSAGVMLLLQGCTPSEG